MKTSHLLIKETLAARKNTSPTIHFEVMQLYSAGALKIACVGLQCIGFNAQLYHTILEQAANCSASGLWKTGWGGPDVAASNNAEAEEETWASGYSGPIYAPHSASM